jgi:hypothetical protein
LCHAILTLRCRAGCAAASVVQLDTAAFEQAVALAKPFNALVHAMSLDSEWLLKTLQR